MTDHPSVDSFCAALDPVTRDTLDAIRSVVSSSRSGLSERIKWNAPSFAVGEEDRITLGLERKGGVRIVLHRGAKPKALTGFQFADPDGLARWLAPDRAILVFHDPAAVEQCADRLRDLCRRWLDATA